MGTIKLKDIIKAGARLSGVELRSFNPSSSPAAQLRAMLKSHGVNLILDVGANVGQFGRELRWHVGYRGRIVSFEPMYEEHFALRRAAAGDKFWQVGVRAAIGAETGSVQINRSRNSVSSSVLPMLQAHESAAPGSAYESTEVVPQVLLDDAAAEYILGDSVVFVKIDTQGYEYQVLRGAVVTLKRSVGVQLELSLVPLYEGQLLMPEVLEYMEANGFDLWAISPTFADCNSGRMLQIDGTFFRKGP